MSDKRPYTLKRTNRTPEGYYYEPDTSGNLQSSRAHIDSTRCPTCGKKWLNCECPPLLQTLRDMERETYEAKTAALEARIAALEKRLDESEGGK